MENKVNENKARDQRVDFAKRDAQKKEIEAKKINPKTISVDNTKDAMRKLELKRIKKEEEKRRKLQKIMKKPNPLLDKSFVGEKETLAYKAAAAIAVANGQYIVPMTEKERLVNSDNERKEFESKISGDEMTEETDKRHGATDVGYTPENPRKSSASLDELIKEASEGVKKDGGETRVRVEEIEIDDDDDEYPRRRYYDE